MGKRCAPRWNSEHNMVDSDENVLTPTQRTTLDEFKKVLDPFLDAKLLLQKEAFSIGQLSRYSRSIK